jgi:Acyl-CoA synthetases (AMP-forming)/AMP-acid ligases II
MFCSLTARTLPSLLLEIAGRYPNRPFLIDGERHVTYSEFLNEAKLLARSFHTLGVRKGDAVAILMGNQVEWLLTQFAVSMLGGVLVALNTWWRQDELRHALELTEPKVLVMVDHYLGNDYVETLKKLGDLSCVAPSLNIICLGEARLSDALSWDGFRALASESAADITDTTMPLISPQDDAMILFTSGSTAKSKGVPLSHEGLVENMYSIGERMHLTEEDRLLLVVSLFWGFGLNASLAFISHGASIVLQPHHDPAETLRLIEAHRCTAIYATPNLVHALYDHPDRQHRDLSSLRTGQARSSVVHLLHEMGAHEVCTMYGMTEGYANSTVTDGKLPLEVRRRISGHPLPNTEVQIVDPETRRVLASGAVGEIRIRGYITRGYCKNPSLMDEVRDEDGWFYTGDLGCLDETGGLEIKGRIKEMIKTGGISVTPADVETLLLQIAGVEQAVVVGVPDPVRDEIVAAMVALKRGATLTPADIVAYCKSRAASYKVPRYIEIVGSENVPLTLTGKVHKEKIREVLTSGYRAKAKAAASIDPIEKSA